MIREMDAQRKTVFSSTAHNTSDTNYVGGFPTPTNSPMCIQFWRYLPGVNADSVRRLRAHSYTVPPHLRCQLQG